MANICDNIFYAYSEDPKNIEYIKEFISKNFTGSDIDTNGIELDCVFDSRWVFPEEEMDELFESLPNKEDIYMRCLSYEFGQYYHALLVCDEEGWREV